MRAELARARANGVSFTLAFQQAFEAISWPGDRMAREEWQTILTETADIWRQCYEGTGAPLDMRILMGALAHGTDEVADLI